MVEFGVVETVQEVDRARPGSREADADLAGPFRVRAGHERRLLFVPHLHELECILVPLERADDGIDAVPRVAVDAFDAVLGETLEEEVGSLLAHRKWVAALRQAETQKPVKRAERPCAGRPGNRPRGAAA